MNRVGGFRRRAGLRRVSLAALSASAAIAQIKTAYSSGTWTGNGITLSVAKVTPLHALGIAEASDLFATFPMTFLGQSVDNTAVLIRCTLPGDANLDGNVNFNDLVVLAQDYGQSGSWSTGDFNYDQTIDFADLVSLAQSYAQALPGSVEAFDADWALAQSLVPEPVSLGALACASLMLLGRRRPVARSTRC